MTIEKIRSTLEAFEWSTTKSNLTVALKVIICQQTEPSNEDCLQIFLEEIKSERKPVK